MLIPHVHELSPFKEALKYAESMDIRLIPYELAKGMPETKEILAAIEPGQSIGIFIGPEGGFEEKEVEAAISEGQNQSHWVNVFFAQKQQGLQFCQF